MTRTPQPELPARPPRRADFARALAAVALALAVALGVALGIHPLENEDLGYHLAFGDYTLDTGKILDSSPFLYTVTREQSPELFPGCWYDETGTYRFVSANWLSEVAMAAVYRWAGFTGLCAMQIAMVAATCLLLLMILRAMGLPTVWSAAAMFLIVMVAYERFNLRPELTTYVLLLGQMYLLVKHASQSMQLRWRHVAALAILQLALVNAHSYFLLGLVMTGCLLADRAMRTLYWQIKGGGEPDYRAALSRCTKMLAIAMAIQVAVCFVNPWGWRLAAMPIQMALYMSANHINNPGPDGPQNPLGFIGELYSPLHEDTFDKLRATTAFIVLQGVVALGAIAALVRRRWGYLAILILMTMVGWSLRRNIAVAAMVLTPLAAGCIYALLAGLAPRWPRFSRWATTLAALAMIVPLGRYLWTTFTSDFYFSEQRLHRFDSGVSRIKIPLDACQWINVHKPVGRLWCDQDSSSNFYYFLSPRRDVPVLTNTWTYPVTVMSECLRIMGSGAEFGRFAQKWNIEIVAIHVSRMDAPLATWLAASPDWTMVYLDTCFAVFLRTQGPNAALAQRCAITEKSQIADAPAFFARLQGLDPRFPENPMMTGALTASRLGWHDLAILMTQEAVRLNPDYFAAWQAQGVYLAMRANHELLAKQYYEAHRDLKAAVAALDRARQLGSDKHIDRNYFLAKNQLDQMDKQQLPAALPFVVN